MTWLTLSDIAAMTQGRLIGDDVAIERVERDSRQVQAGDLFLALAGERFDAHDFVPQIVGKASAALVARPIEAAIPQVVVEDVRLALGHLAAAWRQRYTHPVIGLTGSNGKTTLKEMLTAILSVQGQTLATIGNLNNDIGVPLTLLRLRAEDAYAVIEMGSNHFGEINYLTQIAKPTVAIVNNAGASHLEYFGDIEGVSREKGDIFQGLSTDGIAIINADDTYADYWRSLNTNRQVLSFGFSPNADVRGSITASNELMIHYQGQSLAVQLKLLGQHNQLNALAASAGALAVGLDLPKIKQGLETLQSVKGRLNPKLGLHGGLVIDDTYNANPTSTAAAVKVLAGLSGQRVMVLGDMGELGSDEVELHRAIGLQAAQLGIEQFYSLGKLSRYASQAFGEKAQAFQDIDALISALTVNLTTDCQVLVKGSRSARMERVVEALLATHKEAA